MWKTKDLFFLRSHQNLEKTVAFFLEDLFFFGDHIKIRTKLWYFSRLFWSSQNRRSVIFELTPDPRSAIGAPASLWATAQSKKKTKYTLKSRNQIVIAPICFICPTKFSNSALLFGSYFCCVSLRVIVFFNFRTFRSTPNFRHNAQLFCFFAEF